MLIHHYVFTIILIIFALVSLDYPNTKAFAVSKPEYKLTITYPKDGALFPNEIIAPTFRWQASADAESWKVSARLRGIASPITAIVDKPSWRPSQQEWETIKKYSVEFEAVVTIVPLSRDVLKTSNQGTIRIRTSADPLSTPIFFREVALPIKIAAENPEETRWKVGDISSTAPPRVVLQGMKICANCHSVTPDGKTIGMDVDTNNDKGAYIISTIERETIFSIDKVMTWNDYQRTYDGTQNYGLFSAVSPDGRYVISTVKELPVYQAFSDIGYSQLFFPGRGILVVYDRQMKTFVPLPGASDPGFVQTNAVWSPDGKWIVFVRAQALGSDFSTKAFAERTAHFRYDLYRIPFNGGKGGSPEQIEGASRNGRSNYFPKFTPDGKWIVYTQSDSFMIIQPDAELHIIPSNGGQDRKMNCNTDGKMASWHSIAPGSRWMVFSSKANGPWTQLWLTHIDASGNDTPPVFLENFVATDRAANIPEFLNIVPGMMERIVNKL